ncbi:MAG: hypothetical protein V1914_03235 [archaeon]
MESDKGQEILELAKGYKAASDTLEHKAESSPIKELTETLGSYNQLAQKLKANGIDVENLTEKYFEKITERASAKIEELMDDFNFEDWKKTYKILDEHLDARHFRWFTGTNKDFIGLDPEDGSAIFAPKDVLAGHTKCGIKLYKNGEVSIGEITDNNFEPNPMDSCSYAPSEILWFADIINIAKNYKRLLEKK